MESDDGLILVDSGLGVEDVNEPRRLGSLFNAMVRPRLDVAETALRQVADMGFRPSDVRHIVPTHLDLDHAGGICDFPDAAVHVFADELRAASHRSTFGDRNRYRKAQIASVKKWAAVEQEGETWFGFSAVRAIPGTRDEVLLVPLPGHSRGHCGVAVRRADDWLLHCGDAYFHHSEIEPDGGAAPKGVRFFESMVQFDGAQRRANQARLRELARLALGKVTLICSHGMADFRRDEERGAGSSTGPAGCSSTSAGRRVARGGASGSAKRRSGIAAIGRSRSGSRRASMNQSTPVVLPLNALTAPRRVFSSTRRTWEARVGRVARRRFGRTCAFMSKSVSRARASSRLRGWLAKLWAKMTITPSWVARAPASLTSRIATSFGRLGEPRASNRSSTALATLLTFWPPGPEERTKVSTISVSSMTRSPAFMARLETRKCEERRASRDARLSTGYGGEAMRAAREALRPLDGFAWFS
jgi:glyoxylase-like metal-dependent hydrolase (beta-lactamase superfamily II)